MPPVDRSLLAIILGIAGLLLGASGVAWLLGRGEVTSRRQAILDDVNVRIRAWWWMVGIFVAATLAGTRVSLLLFCALSFLALREFVTLAATGRGDHRALFWSFFIVTPLQYVLIDIGSYGLFSILIPVYGAIFVGGRTVLAGDTSRFLERTAVHQWGLMICVYFLSHVPALLLLPAHGIRYQNIKLMFFLVLVVEFSDVSQYVWGKTIGRRAVAASISPNKTWEGLIGGGLTATALGAALWWATPFSSAVAALMALLLVVMGFAGGLIMSAIKRDRGVKDYGAFIAGHGGILDRIDSLCFAAPIFFHVTRYLVVSSQ
jgi:phosphatidate cytidylyltransferase